MKKNKNQNKKVRFIVVRKFCGGRPPFGLMRDPEDKGHLILDPETAPIIRKIYDYALDGMGSMRIAKRLMEEKIPITQVRANTEFGANYYAWGVTRICHILRKIHAAAV